MTEPQTIAGLESISGRNLPIDALIAFYRAFNARDLEAMEYCWIMGEEPSMDNPIGGIRRGWLSIRAGYERLFCGPASVTVEFHDFSAHGGAEHCLFVGRERGHCHAPAGRIDLRIRTSRLFVLRDGQWRQIHHHGSIEEPGLLADYQRLVLGAPLGEAA